MKACSVMIRMWKIAHARPRIVWPMNPAMPPKRQQPVGALADREQCQQQKNHFAGVHVAEQSQPQ